MANDDRVRLRRNKYNALVQSHKELIEIAKKGINPNCKHCGGTGYDPHPNHMTTYPICLECESWASKLLTMDINP